MHEGSKEGQMHSHDQAEEIAVDPVCGMKVKKSEAAATFEYKEKTYYFCMEGCKKKFKADPEKYLKKKAETKEIYTCPMHPDVKSDKPGKCPKCGMKLKKKMMPVEHEHGEEQEKHMHAEEQEPSHMKQMKAKEESGCPMMEMMSSKDIEMKLENLKDGVAVKITSKNADVVKKIQEMAAKMKTKHSQKEGKKDPVK
jgi:YHS domain-containing protein